MSDATYEGRMPTIDDFCNPEPNEQKEMFPGFPCFLFTLQEFKKAKSRQPMKCRCTQCGKVFFIGKNQIQARIKANQHNAFCSKRCSVKHTHIVNGHNNVCTSYTCQMCGKYVPSDEYYGTGKYCSSHCAHRAIAQMTHTNEYSRKITNSLLIYNQQHQKKEPLSYETFSELTKIYNFSDIAILTSLSRQKIVHIAKKYNILESKDFIDSHRTSVIKACRYALDKSFDMGSITYNDLETVKNECLRLIFDDEIPSSKVCTDFLGRSSSNVSFLRDCMQIHLPSLQEIGNRVHKKFLINKTDREKYYDECVFKFPIQLLPYTVNYQLINQYNWYNPFYPKENGLTKDHRISRKYGYIHNIDPYLISHPANCEIMLLTDNSSKQDKCSITLQQLIEEVEWWNENIIHKIFNDFQ